MIDPSQLHANYIVRFFVVRPRGTEPRMMASVYNDKGQRVTSVPHLIDIPEDVAEFPGLNVAKAMLDSLPREASLEGDMSFLCVGAWDLDGNDVPGMDNIFRCIKNNDATLDSPLRDLPKLTKVEFKVMENEVTGGGLV